MFTYQIKVSKGIIKELSKKSSRKKSILTNLRSFKNCEVSIKDELLIITSTSESALKDTIARANYEIQSIESGLKKDDAGKDAGNNNQLLKFSPKVKSSPKKHFEDEENQIARHSLEVSDRSNASNVNFCDGYFGRKKLMGVPVMERFQNGSEFEEKREMDALLLCDHINVIPCKFISPEGPIYFIFMQYSLNNFYKGIKDFMPEREKKICNSILSGLKYLHSKFIYHGQIKESNILITDQGAVKISDFRKSFIEKRKIIEHESDDLKATGILFDHIYRQFAKPTDSLEISSYFALQYIAINMTQGFMGDENETTHHQMSAEEALNSPLFMTEQESIDFVVNISTYFEDVTPNENDECALSNALHGISDTVLGTSNWTARSLKVYYDKSCAYEEKGKVKKDSALSSNYSTSDTSANQTEFGRKKSSVKSKFYRRKMRNPQSQFSFASVVKCFRDNLQHPEISRKSHELKTYPGDGMNVKIMREFIGSIPMLMVAVHRTAFLRKLTNVTSKVQYQRIWFLPFHACY